MYSRSSKRKPDCIVLTLAYRQTVFGPWRKIGQPKTEVTEVPLEGSSPRSFLREVLTLQEFESDGAARAVNAVIATSGNASADALYTGDLDIEGIPLTGDVAAAVDKLNEAIRAKLPNRDLSVRIDVTAWVATHRSKKGGNRISRP